MLGSRLRNGKQRMLLVLPVGILVLLTIYILRDKHVKLKEAKENAEKCQQQAESLSAQLQVVYEHKSRLEKSLQLEKTQHKKTKDELQSHYQELQANKEKEEQQSATRFNSLQQQYKMLQIQTEDLQGDLDKVQKSNIELLKEKQELQNNYDSQIEFAKQRESEVNDLKEQIKRLQDEIQLVNRQILDRDQDINKLDNQVKQCETKLMEPHEAKSPSRPNQPVLRERPIVLTRIDKKEDRQPEERQVVERNDVKTKPNSDVALEDVADKKPERSIESPGKLVEGQKQDEKEKAHEIQAPAPNAPAVPAPEEDNAPLGLGMRGGVIDHNPQNSQLKKPNFQHNQIIAEHPLALPENGRLLNQKMDDNDGMGVLRVPIGLEQQENGDDQDLDNGDDDGAAAADQKQFKEGKQFEIADFDAADEGGGDVKHDGVMVAPH